MIQLYTTLNNGIIMPLLGLDVYDMYNREAMPSVCVLTDRFFSLPNCRLISLSIVAIKIYLPLAGL